jgi:hypothetical protein
MKAVRTRRARVTGIAGGSRRETVRLLAALAIGAGLLSASPARAHDSLTGTWSGRAKCQTIYGGVRDKGTVELAAVEIDDGGSGGIGIDLAGYAGFMGRYYVDSAKPDRAVLQAQSCEVDPDSLLGSFLHGEFRTKSGSVKATFVGTLILMDGPSSAGGICEVELQRIDLLAPSPYCEP